METRIDPSVIENIQNMDASNDEKIGRLDAYVHEIVYNHKLESMKAFLVAKFGQIGKAL